MAARLKKVREVLLVREVPLALEVLWVLEVPSDL
jgi:hypothetical protein